jgi:hypothetical protein
MIKSAQASGRDSSQVTASAWVRRKVGGMERQR